MIVSPAPPEQHTANKIRQLITDALDRLPKTADGIASYFMERGIQGRCHIASECVVAHYLTAECDLAWVGVTPCAVRTDAPRDFSKPIVVDNPEHLTQFIFNFDAQQYPSLIAGAA